MDPGRAERGRRIVVASWVADAVFLVASVPAIVGVSGAADVAAVVCLALFAVSLGVWAWAFAVAIARSSQGDDIAVGSLFLVEGSVARGDRRALYLPFWVGVLITAVAAASNPFAVLVPMLGLGFVGLWVRATPSSHAARTSPRRAGRCGRPMARANVVHRRGGPMAEHASERIRIDASRDDCLAVVLDFESYPSWARDLKQVTIVERDADGRGQLVEFRAAAMGQSFKYVLSYDYAELPEAFSWVLDSGEKLRQLDGSYRFESEGDGTRVHYDLVVDLSIPLPGIIKRRAAGMIMGTALRELKKAVEAKRQ